MPTALMSSTMLSSVKRLSPDMIADLIISTPFGDSFIPVRVLSHHLDSNHGLVAHIIPISIPITPIDPQVQAEEIGEIIVPFSTLINFRPTNPSPEGKGQGNGLEEEMSKTEDWGDGIVRAQLNILSLVGQSARRVEGRGEGL